MPRSTALWGMAQCHTLAFGNPWWLSECLPTLQDWCARHQHSLKIWGDQETRDLAARKFILVQIIQEFLHSEDDWCLWVDADVYVQPDAPDMATDLEPGFWMAEDPSRHAWLPKWRKWVAAQFKEKPARVWSYRNAGVWALHRSVAAALLKGMHKPYHAAVQEQHHLNYWASLVPDIVKVLPPKWNSMVPRNTPLDDWEPGHFVHLLSRKEEKWKELVRCGHLRKFNPPTHE